MREVCIGWEFIFLKLDNGKHAVRKAPVFWLNPINRYISFRLQNAIPKCLRNFPRLIEFVARMVSCSVARHYFDLSASDSCNLVATASSMTITKIWCHNLSLK